MTRLPPIIASLIPNGDQVVVEDLTLEQVRALIASTSTALAAMLKRNADLVVARDLANARALEAETRRGSAEAGIRSLTRDRDALAERCRVAEEKFTAANQRAIQSERNAVLTPDGLAFATVAMERDVAKARAAQLEAALRGIIDAVLVSSCGTCRDAAAMARAALASAPTSADDGDGWVQCADRMPDYGKPVWAYWPPRNAHEKGMQGVVVLGRVAFTHGTDFEPTMEDRWHAEDDAWSTRNAPLAWRPLPQPPTTDGEGAG